MQAPEAQLRFNLGFLKLDCDNQLCTYLPTFYFKWNDATVKKSGMAGIRSASRNEFSWKPVMHFSNIVECNLVAEHYSYDEESCTAYCMLDYVCKVRTGVELSRFPCDNHKLHFAFKTNANLSLWQANEVEAMPTFAVMEDPFRVGLRDENFVVSNIQFLEREKAHKKGYRVVLWAQRDPFYYLANYITIYFFLGLFALTNYAVSRADFGTRAMILLLVFLSSVAFKAVIAANCPRTAFPTLLDWYALFMKSFLGIILLENYTAATCTNCSDNSEQIFYGLWFGFWIAVHLIIGAGSHLNWFSLSWDAVRQRQDLQGAHYVSSETGTFFLAGEPSFKSL